MHDIKFIRENPAAFDAAMARRKLDAQSPAILKQDEDLRAVKTELQKIQADRNAKSAKIGEIKKSGGDAQAVMDEVAALKARMTELEAREIAIYAELKLLLSSLPNIQKADVPDGKDEHDNVEVKKWGKPRIAKEDAKEHWEIGEAMGMMDFETASKLSGSRFTLLSGNLARLERAIAQFMLDTHTDKNGYTECSPPLMVNSTAMYGTGNLPKFEEDLYKVGEVHERIPSEKEIIGFDSYVEELIEKNNEKGRFGFMIGAKVPYDVGLYKIHPPSYLIPTAEVPLTNIVADMIVESETLPRRYTAFTPCFRSEAGSAGRDTRGMLRQHQFYKVELVSITTPEESDAEHERMRQCAEGILEALELPYRTVVLCTGDAGFGSQKTYDLEVWLPGQNTYREISSCSTCGDFQARRMNARCRKKGEKDTRFVHTLNGSGLAVGRTLIAVLENYYDAADGGVHVPSALIPYMGGLKKIVKK